MRPFAKAEVLAPSDQPTCNLAWLAGVLEAEGTFLRPPPSTPRQPIVSCWMTDRDVIERIAAMLRAGVATIPRARHKTAFVTSLRGSRAVDLMLRLQPIMSSRRNAAISKALAAYRPPDRRLDFFAAEQIRDMYALGSSVSWLARTFDVSRPTIREVVTESIHHGSSDDREPDLASNHFRVDRVATPDTMSRTELFWIAGWLEGEGSFVRPPPSDPRRVRILGVTKDEDVAAEVGRLLGVKPRWSHPPRERRLGWSPIWRILCRGGRAAEIMEALRPLLGTRRQAQIDAALAAASIA